MKHDDYGLIIDEEEIVLEWHDLYGVKKAHLIMIDDGDFAFSACGRHFPSKDVVADVDENQRCKRCVRIDKKERA